MDHSSGHPSSFDGDELDGVASRTLRCTWAVAQRSDGPTSSATTSTTERFEPS
jgi:hypothetical protein